MLFILDLQEHIYTEVPQIHYLSAGKVGRWILGFLDVFIEIFQRSKMKTSWILYLIEQIAYGYDL